MSNIQIKKKCGLCKSYTDILTSDIILKSNKYYHFECYVENELKKQEKKKRGKLTKEEIEIKARQLQQKNNEQINQIKNKEKLFQYIQKSYDVVVLPKPLIIKIESLLDGTAPNISKAISAEDLLDMWQRKKSDLDKLANYNMSMGKLNDKQHRLNYDLAVLLAKYDSYLEYMERMKVHEIQLKEQASQQNINMNKINKIIDSKKDYEEKDDLDSLLDELF